MNAPTERTVLAGDYPVRVLEKGEGQPLLFLHSEMGAGVWTEGLDRLARVYRVLLPDHPGFGPSPLPTWLTGMDDIIVHYSNLLAALGLDESPVRIAGVSFGGWIAAEYASFYPRQVQKLLLAGPLGLRVPELPPPDLFRLGFDEVVPLVFHDPSKAAAVMPVSPDIESQVQMFHDWSAFARLAWSPYLHNPKLTHRLGRANMPALIIWGSQDRLTPPVYAEWYQRFLPSARVAYIQDCGHDPTIEQPEEFASLALEFLR